MYSGYLTMRLGEGGNPGQVWINKGPEDRNQAANNPF